MDNKTTRSSPWYYGFALLVLVLGCLAGTAIAALGMTGLPRLIGEARDSTRLTRVVIPGSGEVLFAEPGAYAVYYEYRSVVDGVEYIGSSATPPALACTLRSNATGEEAPVVPNYGGEERYDLGSGSRAGVLAMRITVSEPGVYTFSCQYPDARAKPEIVLAVGQSIPKMIWDLFGIAARPVGSILVSLALMSSSAVAAIIIAIVVAVSTHPSKRRLDAAQGPGRMKPKADESQAVPI